MPTNNPTPSKKKVKGLPLDLGALNKHNFHEKIRSLYKTNVKEDGEVMVVHEVQFEGDNNALNLTDLTLDQLQQFCKDVGVTYENNHTKFQCRKALLILVNYQIQREQDNKRIVLVDKTTNNIV